MPYRVFITYLSYEHSIFLLQSIFVYAGEQVLRPALFCSGRLSQIFHCYTLAGIGGVCRFGMRVLQNTDKSVVDHHSLAAVFVRAFRFIYCDMLDQFTQQRCSQLVQHHGSFVQFCQVTFKSGCVIIGHQCRGANGIADDAICSVDTFAERHRSN